MKNDLIGIQDELDALTKIIVETVPTEQIYLFGSYAYGTPRKDSDLDIYIVLKDDSPMRDIDAMIAVTIAMYKKVTKPVDLLAIKQNRFLDRSSGITTLERKIMREGIKLYG
ncbi:MAG: nucleotidyltransferase domain-containing protein [Planctomycetaceae bacterium]|jgi:predicted nucleotidyltransferase|nr:nucleotidyltransferase domain-containing protein [Planctomycetaceae bacterium]